MCSLKFAAVISADNMLGVNGKQAPPEWIKSNITYRTGIAFAVLQNKLVIF
jgi:hypothetical protein